MAEPVTAPNDPGWGWTLVYLLDQSSGKIAHQWVLPAQDIRPTGKGAHRSHLAGLARAVSCNIPER